MYTLKRVSGDSLALTREHDAIALPRKGAIDWASFDPSAYDAGVLDRAAEAWSIRAVQEMHSLALFTEIAAQLHLLGAPLDWSGAFARMIGDEVRHTDLCLRVCDALGRPASPSIDPAGLHLLGARPSRDRVRKTVLAAFCVGETISGRMFRRALRAATVPFARDVVAAILVDETFHGELGWELGALLMRNDGPAFEAERAGFVAELPELFRHFAHVACATGSPAWARSEPEVLAGANFGTLSDAGYARAFFDGMEEDVIPGLEAIGLPEARAAYLGVVQALETQLEAKSSERGVPEARDRARAAGARANLDDDVRRPADDDLGELAPREEADRAELAEGASRVRSAAATAARGTRGDVHR